ncbi:hypothetical protein NF681_06995 [Comamonadaceae bacterium OTU4NAUVB1]|nr:hypothetical protein NF681_06995 [Comamonadaceae bacterium OTU4NAUVB1]
MSLSDVEVFYGSKPAAAPAEPAPAPVPAPVVVAEPAESAPVDEEQAEAQAPVVEQPAEKVEHVSDSPPAPWERTPEEVLASSFYDPRTTYKTSLNAIEQAYVSRGATPEQAQEVVGQWWPALGRLSADGGDMSQVADAVAAVTRELPPPERVQEWAGQSMQLLRSEYGDDAGQILKDMRTMVAADPKAKAYLDLTGLGNHPSIVAALAKSARAFRRAGKFK